MLGFEVTKCVNTLGNFRDRNSCVMRKRNGANGRCLSEAFLSSGGLRVYPLNTQANENLPCYGRIPPDHSN